MIHPQYYGVQTPWGIYPASIVQQGQQTPQGISGLPSQPMRSGSGRLTPSGQADSLNNSGNQLQTLPAQGESTCPLAVHTPFYNEVQNLLQDSLEIDSRNLASK